MSEHERNAPQKSATSPTSANASGRKRQAFIGPWQLGKVIGKGGSSRVKIVRHRFTGQYGAVKVITRSSAVTSYTQSLNHLADSTSGRPSFRTTSDTLVSYGVEREIAIMKVLEHPNIITLYDVWASRNELYLVMEYVDGGELFHYVKERKGLPEDETVHLFRQLVSALVYCHRLGICHRDLKPENILLDRRRHIVKLIDFGMAALQPEGTLLSTPCGSPHYAAPEVVSNHRYDGPQADVWSCGVTLYAMLTGCTPFNCSRDGGTRALFRDSTRAKYWMPPELGREAKDLIERIFIPDPRRRITMGGVWRHPFLHQYDKRFGLEGDMGSPEAAIGPTPTTHLWTVNHERDVDRAILRHLRMLWHSETEQGLIQKLLSEGSNQEKLFYAAIVKHREVHAEHYEGRPLSTGDSAGNDIYRPPSTAFKARPLSTTQRSRSHGSMVDDALRQSHQSCLDQVYQAAAILEQLRTGPGF